MVGFVFLLFLMPLIGYFFIRFYRLRHLKISLKIWKCLIMARLSPSFCSFSILFLLSFLPFFFPLSLSNFIFLSFHPSLLFPFSLLHLHNNCFLKKKKKQLKCLQCHCFIAVQYITSNESKINLFLIV